MLKLLERTIHSLDDRLVLLAPKASVPALFQPPIFQPRLFQNVESDSQRHAFLVREMQALRGSIYLHDGAIGRDQLSAEGLHETAEDERSWHLLTLDKNRRVSGCAWYLEHDSLVRVDELRVRHTPLARSGWREKLWSGVETELARARQLGLRYVEVGGWAVSAESRCTSEGLMLALAGYSLGRIRGGCLGITTATVRHGSSSILRRLGGAPLVAGESTVPRYYDPRYDCDMEILRFDSRYPGKKYAGLITLLQQKMSSIHVIAPTVTVPLVAAQTSHSLPPGSWTHGWARTALAQTAFAR
jgi:hypothetical protein